MNTDQSPGGWFDGDRDTIAAAPAGGAGNQDTVAVLANITREAEGSENAAAMLFTAAKVSQLAYLPQGHPERKERAMRMVLAHDAVGFGNCTNQYECSAACPKEIDISNIARLNREFIAAGPVIGEPSARARIEVDSEHFYRDPTEVLPGLYAAFKEGR